MDAPVALAAFASGQVTLQGERRGIERRHECEQAGAVVALGLELCTDHLV
jgi:hypothetical protein